MNRDELVAEVRGFVIAARKAIDDLDHPAARGVSHYVCYEDLDSIVALCDMVERYAYPGCPFIDERCPERPRRKLGESERKLREAARIDPLSKLEPYGTGKG